MTIMNLGKRIELSTRPSLINQGLGLDILTPSMTLCGSILSVEDHGYVVDLGVSFFFFVCVKCFL